MMYGQAFRVFPLFEKQVFSGGALHDVYESRSGILWIASDSGLFRVIGTDIFKVDSRACNKIVALSDTRVLAIGQKNIISCRIDGEINDKPFAILQDRNVETTDIIHISPANDGKNIWVLTQKGVFLIQNNTVFEPVLEGFDGSYSKLLISAQKDSLYIVTPGGVFYVWDGQAMKFKSKTANSAFVRPEKFLVADNGISFMLDQKQVFAIDQHLNVSRVYLPGMGDDTEVTDIALSETGLMIGTSGEGIWLCKSSTPDFSVTRVLNGNDQHRIADLPFKNIRDLQYSVNDNLWIVAENQVWFIKQRAFQRLSHDVPMYSFEKNVLLDNGTIYLDSDGGLWECSRKPNGNFTGKPARLGLPAVQACITSYGNTLWISTMDDEIYYYKDSRLNFVADLKSRGATIFNLCADSGGNVWLQQAPSFAPIIGTLRVTPDKKIVEYGAASGFKSRMLAAKEAPDGTIYFSGIGEQSYLYRYDPEADSMINISVPMPFDYGESFEVHDLAITADNVIWLASTAGLLKYQNNQIEKLEIKDLKDYEAVGLALDPEGALWVATYDKGVVRFRDGEFTVFDVWSGMVTNLQGYRSIRTTPDGIVWAGTREGFMISTPGKHREQQTKEPIMLSVLNEEGGKENGSDKFSYNSTLHFSFVSPTYPVKTVRYAYRLIGMNERWVDLLPGDSLILSNLKEGTYTLEVKASQVGGYAWSAPMNYIFSVNQVWYLQAWALVSFVVLLAGMGASAVVIYNRHLRLENERLEKRIAERTYEIAIKNEEISAQNEEITSQMEEISHQMDQVKKMNEEIASQRDYSNQQRELIEKQNRELANIKSALEEKVKERTSELYRSHQELVEHNIQLEQFAFMTAHNLRAPVARLIGLTTLFNQNEITDPVNREVIMHIHESARNLDEIIRDIATILRVKNSVGEKLEPIQIQPVLQKVLLSFQHEIDTKQLVVQNTVCPEIKVLGIEAYVYSVIYNVVSNTIKYTDDRKKPRLIIESTEKNELIKVTFKDNGVGFDSVQYREKLFKPFSRLNATVDGKGLGLYLMKIEMESMHGNVEIESKPNQGTTIVLSFSRVMTAQMNNV